MFLNNSVFKWRDNIYRLLYIDYHIAVIFKMQDNIKKYKTLLTIIDYKELLNAYETYSAIEITDPYIDLIDKKISDSKSKQIMMDNYKLIEPIVTNTELLFNTKKRRFIINMVANGNESKCTAISRSLSHWWERGQCLNSLFPDYGKSLGKPRNNSKKPGRKSSDNSNPPPINDDIRKLFDSVIEKYRLNSKEKYTIKSLYNIVIDEYIKLNPEKKMSEVPSEGQFKYHYYKYYYNKR